MSVIADIIVDDNKLLIHADGTTEKKLELWKCMNESFKTNGFELKGCYEKCLVMTRL